MYQLLFDVAISSKEDKVEIEDAVLAVKNWFYGRKGRWLLVFDGADSVDNENDDSFVDIQHYIPNSPCVDVIITTRSASAKGIASLEAVEVAEMEITEATALFSKAANLDPKKENEAIVEEIVNELGRLALAINLAGTYISNTPRLQCNLQKYLDEYRERRKELLSQKPIRLVHQYGQSVLTTWETTFSAIAHRCVEASKFLMLLAFFNFDDIFTDLFISANKDHNHDHQREDKSALSWYNWVFEGKEPDIYAVEEYFGILQLYALVQWKRDQMSYSMHKLVHAWTYDRLDMEDLRGYGLVSLGLLLNALSKTSKEPKQKQRLVPHVMANFATVSKIHYSDSTKETALLLLDRSGDFLTHVGRWTDSYGIRNFVYSEMCVLRGDDYLGTISTMSGLASTLYNQGKLEEAAAMSKEVLEKMKRILSEEHPNTISAMNNLATTLGDQGKLEEAAAMKREVLEKRRRILGEEHPDTISAMNNLATTLGDQGKLDEATAMKREVLEKRRRVLSEEHPDTISAMNNLANTLGDQGKLDEAAAMKREVLEKRRRILGEEHPNTISAMNNLAATLGDQGKLDEAAAMKREVLEKRRRILSEEHPDTISALNNLANTLGDQGKLEEAAVMSKEVLEKRRRILGEEHPNTISAMNNLANTLGDQGKLEEAVAMSKEVLEKMKRILGEEHPNTISAMNNLANRLGNQGKLEEAAAMKREVLEKRRWILGEEHPDTISAMNNLASTLGVQGKLEEAAAMLKETYNKMTPLLGNEHPRSRVIRKNLVRAILNRFFNPLVMLDPANREELCERTLHEFEQAFGPEHASTLLMAAITTRVYECGDKLDKAEKMYQRILQGSKKALTPEDTYALDLVATLGQLYTLHGRLRDAEEMYQRALQGYEKALGLEHTSTRDAICRLYDIYFQRCMALRQEQTARLLSNMVNFNEVEDLSDTLVGLTDLCDRFGAVRPSLFGLLGRVLIWIRRADDAVVAFIHQFRLAESKSKYGGTICDGCGKQLNAGMNRFVCKACMDIDLCDECHENYEIDGLLLREAQENCQAHPFLAVPREEKRIWVPELGL